MSVNYLCRYIFNRFLSNQQALHSIGQADTFTPRNPQHQSCPQTKMIFSGKSNNNGLGPGKPNNDGSDGDDDGILKYPQIESIEET